MPSFRYRAYDTSGKGVSGSIDAAGPREAVQLIKSSGLFPAEVAVDEAPSRGRLFGVRIPAQAVTIATRQLANLLSAGTPLSEALSILVENTANTGLKTVLSNVNESVAGGSSLSKALEPHPGQFSTLYRGLVAAGEASGSLDKILLELADYLEARLKMINDVKAAVAYPVLMTFVGAGVLSFLFAFVVPKITAMFEETDHALPLITRALILMTSAFRDYWPVMLVLTFVTVWAVRRYLKTAGGKELKDRLLLRIPWFGPIIESFYVSYLARTLGSLLKGGVQLLRGLEITKEVLDHAVYGRILEEAKADCTGGASLSASLGKHPGIPRIFTHMVGVGEKSGRLQEMLLKTADSYALEFERSVKHALSLLEPALILAMGVVVGFIVLSILLPIFELNQIIR